MAPLEEKHLVSLNLTVTISKLLAWAAAIMSPVKESVSACLMLVAADFILGIWCSLKDGERFSSAALKQTVWKALGYIAAIRLSYTMETHFISEFPVVKVVAGVIAMVEFQSCLENIHLLTGVDIWKQVGRALNRNQTAKFKRFEQEALKKIKTKTKPKKPKK